MLPHYRQAPHGARWPTMGQADCSGAFTTCCKIIYRKIVHRPGYPGEHIPIIGEDLWQKVQTTLATNRVDRGADNGNRHMSLLAGLIHDAHGGLMTPSHAVKKRCSVSILRLQIAANRRR
jgi:hypothetical protein